MSKLEKFIERIKEKMEIKSKYYFANSNILKIQNTGNLIILEFPHTYTLVVDVRFQGKNKNDERKLLEIDEYIEEGLKSLFSKNVEISEDGFLNAIEYSDSFYEEEE